MTDARNNPEKYPLDPSVRAFSPEQEAIIKRMEAEAEEPN